MSAIGAIKPPFETVTPVSKSKGALAAPVVRTYPCERSATQVVRRAIEVPAVHLERLQDVLVTYIS